MANFICLVGLPGSGKSTWANKFKDRRGGTLISSDEIRKSLFGDENVQDRNNEVFDLAIRQIKECLSKDQDVIFDATNINYKRRMNLIKEFKRYNPTFQCIVVATSFEKCLENNSKRERVVPTYVIKNMMMNFYIPQYFEGWDNISIVWNYSKEHYDTEELFNEGSDFRLLEHDNPHHTLTVGEHSLKAAKEIKKKYDDIILSYSALFHDIGKPFVKSFKNRKGEISEIAHFYNHEFVSAYMTMFYLKEEDLPILCILDICQLIQWHMSSYNDNSQKIIKLMGQGFYEKLELLHQADQAAH